MANSHVTSNLLDFGLDPQAALEVAPFILLMPIVGVLASAAFLGEGMTLAALIGGVIIVAGLALVVGFPSRSGASNESSAFGDRT
jgi:drug/metabolite transporter (DMT)-like permease